MQSRNDRLLLIHIFVHNQVICLNLFIFKKNSILFRFNVIYFIENNESNVFQFVKEYQDNS